MDLTAFLQSVVSDYQDAGRAVVLAEGDVATKQTHPQVLRRILQNLIDNALNYAQDVEVRLRVDDSGNVLIEVLDRGPGIPPDRLESVLKPFHRLETSRSRATGGTGLGLAIAQQLTQSIGGTLRLSNRAGGGLQATIALPSGMSRAIQP